MTNRPRERALSAAIMLIDTHSRAISAHNPIAEAQRTLYDRHIDVLRIAEHFEAWLTRNSDEDWPE